MTDKALLREIRRENKAINRNLQRLANIGLIGLLWKVAGEAKKAGDSAGKTLAKMGLLLVAVSELIRLVSDLSDYRKEVYLCSEQKRMDKKAAVQGDGRYCKECVADGEMQ